MIYVIVHEISVILIDYAVDKSRPGRLIQSSPNWAKMAGFGLYQDQLQQKLVNMFVVIHPSLWAKVHKLTLHGGFSCPNRDGTIGRGGCIL